MAQQFSTLTRAQQALLDLARESTGKNDFVTHLIHPEVRSPLVESGAFSAQVVEYLVSPDFLRAIEPNVQSQLLREIRPLLADFGTAEQPGANWNDCLLSPAVVFNLTRLDHDEAEQILTDLRPREGVTGLKVAAFVGSKTLETAEQLNIAMGGFGPTARAEARLLEQFRDASPDDQCRLANYVLKAVLVSSQGDPTPLPCTPDMMFEFVKTAAGWKSVERTNLISAAQQVCNSHPHLITPALIREVSQHAALQIMTGERDPLLREYRKFLNIFDRHTSVTGLDPVLYTCSPEIVTAFNNLGQALQQSGGGPAVGATAKQAPISARLVLCS